MLNEFATLVFISLLLQERKWGPAVGFIGSNLVVAGGGRVLAGIFRNRKVERKLH